MTTKRIQISTGNKHEHMHIHIIHVHHEINIAPTYMLLFSTQYTSIKYPLFCQKWIQTKIHISKLENTWESGIELTHSNQSSSNSQILGNSKLCS